MVAAEDNKIMRERAKTAGTTATGTAARADRLDVQGVRGGRGGSLSFNSGRFGYSNRTPLKIPNDPGKGISWLWRVQFFLGSEGLEHIITTTNPTALST